MPQLNVELAGRIAPVDELVNTLEFEGMAKRKLGAPAYGLVSGGDRKAFEKITFRPRLMVNTTGLDLSLDLLGTKHFAPILVGPVADAARFHTDGEVGLAKGASGAKALIVISSKSSVPVAKVAAEAPAGWWLQIGPGDSISTVRAAVDSGCGAVCLTLSAGGTDWNVVDALRKASGVPIVLKGIMAPEEALAAAQHGIGAVVVSNYVDGTPPPANTFAAPMEVLPEIAKAVSGKMPILLDGGIRRGSDVLKALALGASAVLVARPAVWGLAVHGPAGVQRVVEILQTDLARDMAMCGRPTLKTIDPSIVKINRW